jgi:hypothetical protein
MRSYLWGFLGVLGCGALTAACGSDGDESDSTSTGGTSIGGAAGSSATGGTSIGGAAGSSATGGAMAGGAGPGSQIIADHTVVDRYADIPQPVLDQVQSMWLDVIGESHSTGYMNGLSFLAAQDARYLTVTGTEGEPAPAGTAGLRANRALRNQYGGWDSGGGEAIWYTNDSGTAQVRDHITYCETNSLPITAILFGWCWDMTWVNAPGGTIDPEYRVHWAGSSEGGPDGNLIWGLDAEDTDLTGNHVSMDTYLEATQSYLGHVATNGWATHVVFSTGPVDGYDGENGYQRQLKHDHIRAYVAADGTRILFDYADILAWSDAGTENLEAYVDDLGASHDYQMIHPDNMLEIDGSDHVEDGDHIGGRGALRLGKAIWWMLARLGGWDGT